MKLIVYHTSYGCDTGCCGHIVKDTETDEEDFHFAHPRKEDFREFAEKLIKEDYGEEHIKDLDWDNCEITHS